MTREEAKQIISTWLVSSKGAKGQLGYIEGWFDEEDAEAFRMAIEALTDPNNGRQGSDLIRRQDAIDALGDEPEVWNDTDAEWAERDSWVLHKVAIESLPSAEAVQGR